VNGRRYVDRGRARRDVEEAQRQDLRWLGIDWDAEVPPQRERDYGPWLAALAPRTYRCTCTRSRVAAEGFAPDGGCPGGCRDAARSGGGVRFRLLPGEAVVADRRHGIRRVDPAIYGDPVLQREDGGYAYNLAVVADDLQDGVTEVVRGGDLLEFAAVQGQIWEAFGATPPTWLHVPVVLGPDGRKLSKSHGSAKVRALRAAGRPATDVWQTVLPWLGIEGATSLAEALPAWRPAGPVGTVTAPG
jgi:glutamyl/glutaminyl-tRNA synthetase